MEMGEFKCTVCLAAGIKGHKAGYIDLDSTFDDERVQCIWACTPYSGVNSKASKEAFEASTGHEINASTLPRFARLAREGFPIPLKAPAKESLGEKPGDESPWAKAVATAIRAKFKPVVWPTGAPFAPKASKGAEGKASESKGSESKASKSSEGSSVAGMLATLHRWERWNKHDGLATTALATAIGALESAKDRIKVEAPALCAGEPCHFSPSAVAEYLAWFNSSPRPDAAPNVACIAECLEMLEMVERPLNATFVVVSTANGINVAYGDIARKPDGTISRVAMAGRMATITLPGVLEWGEAPSEPAPSEPAPAPSEPAPSVSMDE